MSSLLCRNKEANGYRRDTLSQCILQNRCIRNDGRQLIFADTQLGKMRWSADFIEPVIQCGNAFLWCGNAEYFFSKAFKLVGALEMVLLS